jgi:serine/threonine protein phosphatase 1
MSQPIYFAIGDIHGEADKLRALHGAILDRIAFESKPARVVHLGDYVDRGPDSRGVIEQILALEAMFAGSTTIQIVSLRGNHEQMMLEAYDGPDEDAGSWWLQGGEATADSYAGGEFPADETWRTAIPKAHINWLRGLPLFLSDEERKLFFVHAGIEPEEFPREAPEIYLWTRAERFNDTSAWPDRDELRGLTVVHGHTPHHEPENVLRRINVDTGACYGGPLTAVVLKPGEAPQFLRVD